MSTCRPPLYLIGSVALSILALYAGMSADALAAHVSAPVETIEVARDEAGMRLDRWFRVHFPDITYGHLQKLLRSGQVRVNSRRVQANARLESRPAGARAGRHAPAAEGEALAAAAARPLQGRPRLHRGA